MRPNLKFEKFEEVIGVYRNGVRIGSIKAGDQTSLPYFYSSLGSRSDLYADELEAIAGKMKQLQEEKRAMETR